jgi:hypothetical protein
MAAKPRIKPGQIPFYTTVTPVKESFKDSAGADQTVDLPLVTLPAGTVLFRGVKIPNLAEAQDIRYLYRDFLGNPEADGIVCMSPVHNVFFYPTPHIAFGTHTIGKTFNMLEMVVLVHPVNVVCSISPSSWVRGQGQRYSGTAPWQRCGNFQGPEVDCHPPSFREQDAKNYDNCLLPEYQVKSGTRGWMAIADLDSINPKKKSWGSTKPMAMKDSTMGSYIRELHSRLPDEANDLLLKTYRDDHQHAGFPEIALYPYKTHQGRKTITRRCSSDSDAIRIIAQEAKADNLNYLPLALITHDGVIDMVNGYFSYSRLGLTGDWIKNMRFFGAHQAQINIERHTVEYMKMLQEKGISLPFYGKTKLSFDSRTGFYIFPTVVPSNLKLKIPENILYKNLNAATPSNANRKIYENELYRNFCMPLESEEDKRRVRIYEIMFRSFLPDHFLEKYGLEPGYGRRRAFVFERYPFLDPLFKELEIPFPKQLAGALGRAGALYRKETGKKKKEKPAALPAGNAAGAVAASAVAANLSAAPSSPAYAPASPAYYPSSPAYGEEEGHTPEFGPDAARTPPYNSPHTPEFGGEVGGRTPPYNAGVPAAAGTTPPLPPKGGYRGKTRGKGKKSRRQTRRSNITTNTNAMEKLNSNAMMFSNVWATHGSVKQRLNS